MACLISFKDGQTEGWSCACKIGKIPWEEVFLLSLYHMAQSSGRFNRCRQGVANGTMINYFMRFWHTLPGYLT